MAKRKESGNVCQCAPALPSAQFVHAIQVRLRGESLELVPLLLLNSQPAKTSESLNRSSARAARLVRIESLRLRSLHQLPDSALRPSKAASGVEDESPGRRIRFIGLTCAGFAGSLQALLLCDAFSGWLEKRLNFQSKRFNLFRIFCT